MSTKTKVPNKNEIKSNHGKRACPFFYQAECDCATITDLLSHFKKSHKDRVLVFADNIITVKNSFEKDTYYLITTKVGQFLLHIKFDVVPKTYSYAFYYFDANSNNDPYTFTLLIENKEFNIVFKSVQAKHISKFNRKIYKNHALSLGRSVLPLICNKKVVFALNYEHKKSNHEIDVRLFECPVCFHYMLNEIHICSAGHSICQKCMKQLDKCPTCKSPFSGRNYSMESLIRSVKVPRESSDIGNNLVNVSE